MQEEEKTKTDDEEVADTAETSEAPEIEESEKPRKLTVCFPTYMKKRFIWEATCVILYVHLYKFLKIQCQMRATCWFLFLLSRYEG